MNPPEPVNILLVDDEPRNLAVLESILDDPGYRLVRATSGDEALLRLVNEEFALLVLDVQMPGMSGFEVAQMVKQRRKTARIPIVFLTAYFHEDRHILEGYGTGAVDYLQKPVNPAVLRSKVSVFAELHRKERELAQANRQLLEEVAERRRAEERLSELNASLDQRVTERTAALRESESRLLEASRRKDEFLATLAHELRNPLAPVRNAVHFLKLRGPGTTDVQWASELIDRQVSLMGRLIEELMDVSRIGQGRIELRRELLTLDQVLGDALETVQPQIDGAGHKLTVLQPATKLTVHGDRARLAQAFINLLSNAAKYTDPGGQLELRVVSEDGTVLVSIRDNGIGISPRRLEQVFEMFSQEEPALSRARGGLGIGLSLTRKLVELHGGIVTASSEGQGQGSVFTVRLPLAQAPAEPRAPADNASPRREAAGTLRILVADDNVDAAETLAMLLESLGHSVHRVHDGDAAVAAVPAFDPELVVLDIGMPGTNGYEACRQIREQAGGGARTLIALTGWGQPQDQERARAAGFDQHLVKPVDIERLLELISARLDGSVSIRR
ncbi:response regulator [Ramlibacter ginsenosidimutans]|uniref:histidine kinase n=1 Tax=Ramlibacter ginsenosidimutans TaxID=502333 RepID=A0A934WKX3_9BURK|nr:response regulator [Ramlibacter ginsenosidimutans]MBK6004971.1 response regulator [Ramlibacter ginsenosidimutans]